MLVEGGLLHGGVGTLATFKTHRGFRGVASHNVRLQLELGDAPVVALPTFEVFLNFDCTQILPRDLDQRPPASSASVAAASKQQQCEV